MLLNELRTLSTKDLLGFDTCDDNKHPHFLLEDRVNSDSWMGLARYHRGEGLYKDNRFLVFSEKTRWSIGSVMALGAVLLNIGLVSLILLRPFFTEPAIPLFPVSAFSYAWIAGICVGFPGLRLTIRTVRRIHYHWKEIRQSNEVEK